MLVSELDLKFPDPQSNALLLPKAQGGRDVVRAAGPSGTVRSLTIREASIAGGEVCLRAKFLLT